MNSVDKATETQLSNIQKKTGKTLEELTQIVQGSGLSKHSEIRAILQQSLGLGYGDANTLALFIKSSGESAAQTGTADVLTEIYSGPKASLRPIHEHIIRALEGYGAYETAPKKGYVSLRRKKQFAMLGPATKSQVELGLNIKDLPESARLKAQPAGSMCNYTVRLSQVDEVDAELLGWLRQAFESAG